MEIRAKCRKLKLEKNLGMVVIDYLQLVQGSIKRGGSREQTRMCPQTLAHRLRGEMEFYCLHAHSFIHSFIHPANIYWVLTACPAPY